MSTFFHLFFKITTKTATNNSKISSLHEKHYPFPNIFNTRFGTLLLRLNLIKAEFLYT